MKNGLKAVGKAVVYLAVYLLMQVIVSFAFSTALTAKITMEIMASGEELDMIAMTELVTSELMNNMMTMTLVAGIVTLFVFWIVFVIRKKKFVNEVCIRKIPAGSILPIAVLAASFNVITSVVISMFPWPQGWIDSYAQNSSAIDGSIMAWVTAVLMAPILEEIVFRGLMYTRLKKGLPMLGAAIITSLAFGLAHGTIIWAIYTFIFSMVLIWVFEQFQSLTACILLHMAYNISGMALSLIPEEAGIVVLILFAAAFVGVYFAYKKIMSIVSDIPEIEERMEEVEAAGNIKNEAEEEMFTEG